MREVLVPPTEPPSSPQNSTNPTNRIKNPINLKTLGILLLLAPISSNAATLFAGNISNLGTDFLLNAATTGGGDTNAAPTASFTRDLATLGAFNLGAGGTSISITGFGFAALGGSPITATQATMTITYLGFDGVSGGGDDVSFGSVTDGVVGNASGSTYYWSFDSPLTKTIDGANSIFRFDLTSNATGNFRFKTTSGTSIVDAKFSVAGTSTAVLIPEPSAVLLGALGFLALLRRRR